MTTIHVPNLVRITLVCACCIGGVTSAHTHVVRIKERRSSEAYHAKDRKYYEGGLKILTLTVISLVYNNNGHKRLVNQFELI